MRGVHAAQVVSLYKPPQDDYELYYLKYYPMTKE